MERLVAVEEVRVEGRHRHDMGDLDGLAKSIEDVGLINPITLTSDLRLVAGGRRLEAFHRLGREKIPARVVESLADAAACLRAERDENTCRKGMLPSEKAALGAALYEVEAAAAKERQREAGQNFGKGIASPLQGGSYEPDRKARETNALVGEALGMSRSTYEELRFAHKTAHDDELPVEERQLAQRALDEMDSGRGIQPSVMALRRSLEATRKANTPAEPEPVPEPDPAWIPDAKDRTAAARNRRRMLIREWAAAGWTTNQIAKRLDIYPNSVRKITATEGIEVPADAVFGRTGQGIDSNRIVRETVNSLAGLDLALEMVDFNDLDRSQIENWTVSLSKSITVLKRLNEQLKEKVQ